MGKSLKNAQDEFLKLLGRIERKSITPFLQWIEDTYLDDSPSKPKYIEDANLALREMAEYIRPKVPVNAVLPSENIAPPLEGHDADCKDECTANVDCFLYEEDEVEECVKAGTMSRSYCVDCLSRNIKPLTFISHSLSIPQLEFMFTKVIPLAKKPEGFTVVDIGSRFGSILAAAHLYSHGKTHAIGIELNEELCNLQREAIAAFNMENIDIVHSDVRNQGEIIAKADVIVMNNVFAFFLNKEEHIDCWNFLISHIKKGTFIIHNPAIDFTVSHLNLPDFNKWLKKIDIESLAAESAGGNEDLFEDLSSLCLYEAFTNRSLLDGETKEEDMKEEEVSKNESREGTVPKKKKKK